MMTHTPFQSEATARSTDMPQSFLLSMAGREESHVLTLQGLMKQSQNTVKGVEETLPS